MNDELDACSLSGAVEDELHERRCWHNGFDGRPCSLPSYMTIIDFERLAAAWKELLPTRPREEWDAAIGFFETTAYLSPSISLLARTLRRWLDRDCPAPTECAPAGGS